MRVDLPGGDWVELVDRLNHAQMRRIRQASNDPERDSMTEGVAAMATGWLLHDVQGTVVPFPGAGVDGVPSGCFDAVGADVMLLVAAEALSIATELGKALDPKGSAGTSPGLPPARRSRRTRTWQMHGSSPTIPVGHGTISSPPRGN